MKIEEKTVYQTSDGKEMVEVMKDSKRIRLLPYDITAKEASELIEILKVVLAVDTPTQEQK